MGKGGGGGIKGGERNHKKEATFERRESEKNETPPKFKKIKQ
jgi:hypothetical protein